MKVTALLKNLSIIYLLGFSASAMSASIFYEVDALGGNSYNYHYTIENQTVDPIEEFTIFFELGLYENLVVTTTPLDWDSFVAQPDAQLPDDGFFDSLALVSGIQFGDLLSGFSVQFDYLGAGTPGSQFFEIIDPITFDPISDGFTQPLQSSNVPEPSTVFLIALGLLFIGYSRINTDTNTLKIKAD